MRVTSLVHRAPSLGLHLNAELGEQGYLFNGLEEEKGLNAFNLWCTLYNGREGRGIDFDDVISPAGRVREGGRWQSIAAAAEGRRTTVATA